MRNVLDGTNPLGIKILFLPFKCSWFVICIWNKTSWEHEQFVSTCKSFIFVSQAAKQKILSLLHVYIIFEIKISCNILLQLNMAKRIHPFLAFWVLQPRKQINCRKTKFTLTWNFQKMIRALAFSSCEKFGNSFYFKFRGIVWYSKLCKL